MRNTLREGKLKDKFKGSNKDESASESNKQKIEATNGLGNHCSTMRNPLLAEKYKVEVEDGDVDMIERVMQETLENIGAGGVHTVPTEVSRLEFIASWSAGLRRHSFLLLYLQLETALLHCHNEGRPQFVGIQVACLRAIFIAGRRGRCRGGGQPQGQQKAGPWEHVP